MSVSDILSRISPEVRSKLKIEEADQQRFLFDAIMSNESQYFFNNAPCGSGKTHAMKHILGMFYDKRFVIVRPSHELCEELCNELNKEMINCIHIYGKRKNVLEIGENGDTIDTGVKPCMRPNGEEYFSKEGVIGCGGKDEPCPHKYECLYMQQFRDAENCQVVVCVLEHLHRFGNRIVWFDESYDQKIMKTMVLQSLTDTINVGIDLQMPEIKKCGKNQYNFYRKVVRNDKFRITNENTYFLNSFFETTNPESRQAYMGEKGEITLFARMSDFMPEEYDKIIFNCATTGFETLREITNTQMLMGETDWHVYTSKNFSMKSIDNDVFKFTYGFTKNMAKGRMPEFVKFLKQFGCIGNDVFIGTKQCFEKELVEDVFRPMFGDDMKKWPRVQHAGAGRASNKNAREFKLSIVYGAYHFTPVNHEMFRRIGFSENSISEMEDSEVKQLIHRVRPILYNTPIFLLTNKDVFDWVSETSYSVIKRLYNFYDHKFEDETIDYIREKYGITNSNTIKDLKRLSAFMHKLHLGEEERENELPGVPVAGCDDFNYTKEENREGEVPIMSKQYDEEDDDREDEVPRFPKIDDLFNDRYKEEENEE